MDVVSDLLDLQLLDRQGREMRRASTGIEIEARIGPPAETHRRADWPVGVGIAPASRTRPLDRRDRRRTRARRGTADPDRRRRRSIHDELKTELSLASSAAGRVEHWLRRWLRGLPGAADVTIRLDRLVGREVLTAEQPPPRPARRVPCRTARRRVGRRRVCDWRGRTAGAARRRRADARRAKAPRLRRPLGSTRSLLARPPASLLFG